MRLKFNVPAIVLCSALMLMAAANLSAQGESLQTAERLMAWQLEAVTKSDHKQFIQHGNQAFKQFMDAHTFDSIVMQRGDKLKKGFRLEYMGAIARLGMQEHFWRVCIQGYKYQFVGSLSVSSHGKVVGFDLY